MWQPVDAQTGKRLTLKASDWPIAIHGRPKSGASFFTVAVTADLFRREKKIVFLCAHAEAIKTLKTELGLDRPVVQSKEVTTQTAGTLEEMQLVTIMKRRGTDPAASLRALPDWSKRIVVIKNIEETLTPELWAIVTSHKQLVLSGDFEKEKNDIDQNVFSSSIVFSPAPGHWRHQREAVPTYIGGGIVGGKKFQLIVQEK